MIIIIKLCVIYYTSKFPSYLWFKAYLFWNVVYLSIYKKHCFFELEHLFTSVAYSDENRNLSITKIMYQLLHRLVLFGLL